MSGSNLKRSLLPLHLAAIGMGTTIGVGWIVVTGGWIVRAGPGGASLAFAAGGLVMGLVALCYTDLATRLPHASGEYDYVSAALGREWAFVVGWAALLGYIGICCFEGLALAWLIGVLAPDAVGPTLYTMLGTPVHALDVALVSIGAIAFTALNYAGARESARLQVAVAIGKVGLSLAFVLIGLLGGDLANWEPAFRPAAAPWAGVATVLVVVPAWFCGFNALPQALQEAVERPRAGELARLLWGVIALTTIFYVAVIAATAAAAPRATIADAELPVVAAIDAVIGPWGGRIVLLTGIVALLSAWNAAIFAASRLIHTLGRDGALPATFARVHQSHGTPGPAVLFVGAVTLGGGFMGRSFIEPGIQLGAIGFAIAFVATCISSLRLPSEAPGRTIVLIAAAVGAFALSGVLALSLHNIFLGRGGWPAEATALLGWTLAGIVLRILASRSGAKRLHPA